MEDNTLKQKIPHNVIMEACEKLTVSGVKDIYNYNDEIIEILTEMGILTVKGADLHINRLSLETGELLIEGEIFSLVYSEKEVSKAAKDPFFSRIFR